MKKTFLALIVVLSILGLTACGQDMTVPRTTVSTSSGTKEVPTQAPQNNINRLLRVSISSDIDSFDPWLSTASDTQGIMSNVFEGLVGVDSNGHFIPILASEWTISDDGLKYRFKLKEGIKFHNGQDLTVDDVLYTYENLAGLNGKDPINSKLNKLESIESLSPDEVEFVFSEPSSTYLSQLMAPILKKGYAAQAAKPVGTGPYMFLDYVPGQKLTLIKNPDYTTLDVKPSIDQVEVYIINDISAVLSAMHSKQLDLATVYNGEAIDLLSKEMAVHNAPSNMVQLLALNNQFAPLDRLEVRQAINYAIDKDAIIKNVFGGYATKLNSGFSPVLADYYNDQLSEFSEFNVDKAKALLNSLNLDQPIKLNIKVPANYQAHINTAQIIVEELKAIGIEASISLVEWTTWLEDVYKNKNFEATLIGLSGKVEPDAVLGRYMSSNSKNFINYSNEDYDRVLNEAYIVKDEAKRQELYKEAQLILAKDYASVFISDPNNMMLANPKLDGIKFYPINYLNFRDMFFKE